MHRDSVKSTREIKVKMRLMMRILIVIIQDYWLSLLMMRIIDYAELNHFLKDFFILREICLGLLLGKN